MDSQELFSKLKDAQELMSKEKYKDALILLYKLKEIEKSGDFDYNLTHKLYQLISNSESLYNQKVILKVITDISQKQDSISIAELNKILLSSKGMSIEDPILRREIEILILRSLITCKIDKDKIVFT